MFKFNFGGEQGSHDEPTIEESTAPLLASEEVVAAESTSIPSDLESIQLTEEYAILKGRVSNTEAAGALHDNSIADSDLVPGKYEGGFKLWEGGVDLASYLITNVLSDISTSPALPLRVLELGCGHGLPGIVALLKGATVDYQDYNKEVLEVLTIPTVLSNWQHQPTNSQSAIRGTAETGGTENRARAERPPARFFCGDWGTLGDLLGKLGLLNAYDMILTTETIYTLEGMGRLFKCIKQCLKRPSGVCYVSAKSFYFGVGGGVAAFLELVNADPEMVGQVALTIDDGMSNRREILVLKWRETL